MSNGCCNHIWVGFWQPAAAWKGMPAACRAGRGTKSLVVQHMVVQHMGGVYLLVTTWCCCSTLMDGLPYACLPCTFHGLHAEGVHGCATIGICSGPKRHFSNHHRSCIVLLMLYRQCCARVWAYMIYLRQSCPLLRVLCIWPCVCCEFGPAWGS